MDKNLKLVSNDCKSGRKIDKKCCKKCSNVRKIIIKTNCPKKESGPTNKFSSLYPFSSGAEGLLLTVPNDLLEEGESILTLGGFVLGPFSDFYHGYLTPMPPDTIIKNLKVFLITYPLGDIDSVCTNLNVKIVIKGSDDPCDYSTFVDLLTMNVNVIIENNTDSFCVIAEDDEEIDSKKYIFVGVEPLECDQQDFIFGTISGSFEIFKK